MHHEIDVRPEQGLVVVTTHGTATLQGFMAFSTEVSQPAIAGLGLKLLADHRDLDLSTLKKDGVDAYRRFCATLLTERQVRGLAPLRAATVVARMLDYGIARQWEIPLADALPMVHRSFLNFDEALAWLTDGDDAPGVTRKQ